jgi:hypothetical protein
VKRQRQKDVPELLADCRAPCSLSNMRMQSDRFAREIVGILALSYAARSRRLMRRPLGRHLSPPCQI